MQQRDQQKRQNLTLCRRLAADILKCGRNKVQFNVAYGDPEQQLTTIHNKIRSEQHVRAAVRGLIDKGYIQQRADKNVSRYRFRRHAEAKSKGRHTGYGKRHGTRNARMPEKTLWIQRVRAQRRILRLERGTNKRYEDGSLKKLTPSEYHTFYYRVKGNQFKHKRALLEALNNMRQEKQRQATMEARSEAAKSANLIRNARARALKQGKH